MAILIDTPRWPAHGTQFGHLVSDHSLVELHRFARSAGIDLRAFDHDHYDVAVRHFDRLVQAGAHHVPSSELVTRLAAGGLRVRRQQRLPSPQSLLGPLHERWSRLVPGAAAQGHDLLAAWSAPTRHYHDPRHLWLMSAALEDLCSTDLPALDLPALDRPALDLAALELAAWFHDAVYDGVAGDDEERSAQWAESSLPGLVPDETVAEVARLVRLTITHDPTPDDPAGQAFSDADLSTLAGPEARYWMYARAIRLEYADVPDDDFRAGRSRVLQGFLDQPRIFRTETGHRLWEHQARANVALELDFLLH